ncbi:MAG: hypothetical protein ACPLW9_01810 [Minisyncoccales bacterium]
MNEQIKISPEEKPEESGEKQVIEGVIGESLIDWEKKLPPGVLPHMVDRFLGHDNLWHWHLLPEYIKDKEAREKYEKERSMWP